MFDYCLQTIDQAEFDGILLLTGLGVDSDGAVVPASSEVLIDRIGPITRQTGTDANGDPVFVTHPEYHVNLRLLSEPTAEQAAALAAVSIAPGPPQYRVWA